MVTFSTLASVCAPKVAAELLVAIAAVGSGIEPLAIRDGAKTEFVRSVGHGVAAVVALTDQGRTPQVGLMALPEQRLREAKLTVAEGFDACLSLKAAADLFHDEMARAEKRGVGPAAWDRAAIRSWWLPSGPYVSGALLEAAVMEAKAKAPELLKRDVKLSPEALERFQKLQKGDVPAVAAMVDAAPAVKGLRAKAAEPEKLPEKPVGLADAEPAQWDVFGRARRDSRNPFVEQGRKQ